MRFIYKSMLVVPLLLTLGGCGIYKKYELPAETPIISDYAKATQMTQDSTAFGNLGWREVFNDPFLRNYIDKALQNNKDLNNARLNVEIAQAQLLGAKLSYFPSLAFTPNGGSASYGGSHMDWSYTLPLTASWEIDAFGKILNRKRGAQMSVEMAKDYERAVRSQIVASVANVYYSIVALNLQLDLSQRTAILWKEQVESMELMKQAGRVNEAAVVQTRANYYSILASIPDIKSAIRQMNNTLSLLLNEYPQEWNVTNRMEFSAPSFATEGVPMYYLATRPDVHAAEMDFATAYYATNSARAAFYPSIVISAQGGFTNLLGSMITNPGKWFIQLAGSLTAPIFSRGQNIASLKAAKAQQEQALNNFQYSVLNASAEVSDALVSYNTNNSKQVLLDKQVGELEKSVEYTQELLTLGQSTYLEVLTAQQGLLSAQLGSINCWHSKVAAVINLYQSLGGGR